MAQSLSTKLVGLLTIALLPLGLIAVVQTYTVVSEAEKLSQREMLARTMEAARAEVEVILEAQGAAYALGSAAAQIGPDQPLCTETFRQFADAERRFVFAGFIEASGRMRCKSSGEEIDFSGSETWNSFIEDPRPTVVVSTRGRSTGVSVLIVSMPIFSRQNELIGTASVSIPHSLLDVLVDNKIEGLEVALLDGDGTIMSASGVDGGQFFVESEEFAPNDLSIPLHGMVVDLSENTSVSVIPIRPFDLYLVGRWSDGSRPFKRSVMGSAAPLFPIVMWIASLFVATYAIQQLVLRHLKSLRRHMRRFSIDNLESSYIQLDNAPSEIGEISDSYNALLDRIIDDAHQLAVSAEEKENLLKEVHHRVKNNLQLIASILNMQLRQIDEPEVQTVLKSVQQRVMSLATIHKLLYADNRVDSVRVDMLLSQIINSSTNLARSETSSARTNLDLAPVSLDPDRAVPLALLATEAITNAMKYMDAEGADDGEISMVLEEIEGGDVRLIVRNSLNPDGETRKDRESTGLGSKLIRAFVTQLDGQSRVEADGSRYSLEVVFPKDQDADTPAEAA